MTTPLLVMGVAVAAALGLALRPLIRAYLRARGTRVVTCPEIRASAAIELDPWFAALSAASLGTPERAVRACSRWPERQKCGQDCLAQVEAAPEGCLARTMLGRWFGARSCALCRRPFGEIGWADHRPAFLDPAGRTRAWEEVRAEEIPSTLATHRPVCWDCFIAERFRDRYPSLIVEGERLHAAAQRPRASA